MATYTTKQQKAVLDCLSERADEPEMRFPLEGELPKEVKEA